MPSPYAFPAISVGDIVLHTLVGTLLNQTIMTTFWYECVTAGALDKQQAMSGLDASLEGVGKLHARYRAAIPDNMVMVERWYQVIAPIRYVKYIIADTRPGTGVGPADTANVACVYERRSGLAGRKQVGIVHLPCPTTSDAIADGLLTGAQKINVQNLATENQNDVSAGSGTTFSPILYTRPKLSPPTPSEVHLLYDCFVRDRVRVQRRRTVGLGI